MKKFLGRLIFPLILGVLFIYREVIFAPNDPKPPRTDNPQNHINRVDMMLTKNGTPAELGYMTSPLRIFSEDSLDNYQKLRLKKWDSFDIITKDFALIATIADFKLFGRVRFNFFDFETKNSVIFEKNILPIFKPKLSATSYRSYNSTLDDIIFEQGEFKFMVKNTDNKVSAKYHTKSIVVSSPSDKVEVDFEWKITPQHEILGLITQLDSNPKNFMYNVKIGSIPVLGKVNIAGKEYKFTTEDAAGGLDWARGVFPYNVGYWSARAQGVLENERAFSIQFGSGLSDTNATKATEDSFTVDRYVYKLNYVVAKYDPKNVTSTWTFETEGRSVAFSECFVKFTPIKTQKHSFSLFVVKSNLETVFGTFSGYVTNAQGKKFQFEDFNGYVEVYKAKW